MANHKDAIKRIKQNEKRRVRNRAYRTRMRSQIKKLRAAIDDGNAETAHAELSTTVSIIQRLATKGVIHRNQASRRVKRLHAAVRKIGA